MNGEKELDKERVKQKNFKNLLGGRVFKEDTGRPSHANLLRKTSDGLR